jgi:chemosensory pili system protein ChpA (sensor histidine kinase/response regulator)
MDGFELATQVRNTERLKHIPIIMITSRTGNKHRERASKIGIDRHLGKPFNEMELMESINALLAEKS